MPLSRRLRAKGCGRKETNQGKPDNPGVHRALRQASTVTSAVFRLRGGPPSPCAS
jgi:hypothetical protein